MTVEFRLLGDVEARLDELRLEIGHARQRCVLVALLVDMNRPVPADQLIDRVWADHPPHRARNALAGYLSRLRQLLADAEEVQISREPGGYVLIADALSVDVHRFRHLASQARATADPLDAAALFDRALDLWRGEPFASLDTRGCLTSAPPWRPSGFPWHSTAMTSRCAPDDTPSCSASFAAPLRANPLDERLVSIRVISSTRRTRSPRKRHRGSARAGFVWWT
jgi:Bacterial transcriptional activator domain